MNEYLKEFKLLGGDRFLNFEAWRYRDRLVSKYSWAVPSDEVIQKIASFGKIIEMGAGSGYWAHLISEAGGDILAIDNGSRAFEEKWHNILLGGPSHLGQYSDRVLFLCWPDYDTDFGGDCLKAYKGDTLLYVGESEGGCCGGKSFWEELHYNWEETEYLSIPQWDAIHDAFYVYKRRAERNPEKHHWWLDYDDDEEDDDE